MLRRLRLFASAMVLVGVAGSRAVSAQSADAQAVMAANAAFYDAISARDAAALAKVYAHEDFVMNVTPDGKYRGPGWAAVEPWIKNITRTFAQLEVKPSDVHVHVNGDVGWVMVTEHVSARLPDGPPQQVTLQATNIFERIGGNWLMTQHQPTLVAK